MDDHEQRLWSVVVAEEGSIEIEAGAELTVSDETDEDESIGAVFDAEGDRTAGTASPGVTVSAIAANSDGVERDLSVDFSATWDVPVAAELVRFTSSLWIRVCCSSGALPRSQTIWVGSFS